MNECDVQYKASKNQRLTVELAIMKNVRSAQSTRRYCTRSASKKKSLAEVNPPQPVQTISVEQESKPIQEQVVEPPVQETTSEESSQEITAIPSPVVEATNQNEEQLEPKSRRKPCASINS